MSVDLEQARQKLVAERDRVAAELEELQEDLGTSLEDATDEDGVDSHLGDSATETLDREVEQGLEDNAERLLAGIEAALQRIEDGTYGICERCGEPIDEARLEALPHATKCIECKRLEERG
ncbi:MAG: TraR/DksA family transcriptional regulator [Gaiellales bacterium]|nr:TraR/DksA C4-type zinc finger protein [Gaiellales bacterium]